MPLFSRLFSGALLIVAAALAGCATFSPPLEASRPPAAAMSLPFASSRPVALVLSGGTARGFAHIGVIKALEEAGIKPDLIVGSSAGSIVGALYASGLSSSELETALAEMGSSILGDLTLPKIGVLPGALGLVKGEKLRNFMRRRLRHELIEDFPIRFAAVSTNLHSGKPHAFNTGEAALAALASSAVPGVFSPVRIEGKYFADGQISSPLPVDAARGLGAKVIIAVDVTYPPEDASLSTFLSVVFQAFIISVNRLRDFEIAGADVVIEPEIPRTSSQFGFGAREALVDAGYRAAQAYLPRIRQAIERN